MTDVTAQRMAFRAGYTRLADAWKTAGRRPKVQVSLGTDPTRRADAVRAAVKAGRLPNQEARRLLPEAAGLDTKALPPPRAVATILDFPLAFQASVLHKPTRATRSKLSSSLSRPFRRSHQNGHARWLEWDIVFTRWRCVIAPLRIAHGFDGLALDRDPVGVDLGDVLLRLAIRPRL